MFGSRWVTIPSWLSGSLITFLYFFCIFLPPFLNLFFGYVLAISFIYCAYLCMQCSLGISNFLKYISHLSYSWGESKLAKMSCSGSVATCFINNDHVTAEIIYSTARVCHEVLTWSRVTLCCTYIWASPIKWGELLLYHGCIYWVSHERREYSVNAATAISSARRKYWCGYCVIQEVVCSYVVLCYVCGSRCCASQRRIDVSAVPDAPGVFFRPLSLHLAYPGFSI